MACIKSGKAFLYHAIFYGIQLVCIGLAGFIIYRDLDPRISSRNEQMDTNIVGDNPGLSFRPMKYHEDGTPSQLIWYKTSDPSSYLSWTESLAKFLDDYKPLETQQICDSESYTLPGCTPEAHFNFHKAAPCIFLRLNMPPGWTPVYYNDTNSLPPDMPYELKDRINQAAAFFGSKGLNRVWLSCDGEYDADQDNIGPMAYIPFGGSVGDHFTNENRIGCPAPIAAVLFERPRLGVLINIKCKVWARNIQHEDDSALGGVSFQLLID